MKQQKLLWHRPNQQEHLQIQKHQKSVPLHTHNFDELVFILSGSGVHVINKEKYPLMRGDVFVIKGKQAHRFEKNKNMLVANLEYMWERFESFEKEFANQAGFKALFVHEPLYRKNQKFKARLHLTSWQLDEISILLDSIKNEEETQMPGYNKVIEYLFKIVVVNICRYFSESKSLNSKKLLKISAAIDYIETNFEEKITRETLANTADMNFNSFLKIFKDTTGCSPIDYLIRFRIEKAVEMIKKNLKLNVTDIALNCGFENSSYFTRKFKQITGTTPMKCIKKQRETGFFCTKANTGRL